MYIGNNSVCVIKFHFIFFCYSLKNIIPLILSGNIPNEICRNDTYKVLNGLWQIKPWALRSKYSLYGCEDCCPPILICASQKTEEKYFVGLHICSPHVPSWFGERFYLYLSYTPFPLLLKIDYCSLLHFLIRRKTASLCPESLDVRIAQLFFQCFQLLLKWIDQR